MQCHDIYTIMLIIKTLRIGPVTGLRSAVLAVENDVKHGKTASNRITNSVKMETADQYRKNSANTEQKLDQYRKKLDQYDSFFFLFFFFFFFFFFVWAEFVIPMMRGDLAI